MSNNLINLNTATEEELIELPGIAKGLAARIVQYREKVHPFEEVIELASVPGISERMVRELEGQVSISANGSKTDVGSTVVEQAESVVEEEMADDIADTDVPIEDVPLAEVDVDADMGEAIDSANIEESINRIPEVTLVSSLGEVVAEHAPIEEAPAEPAMDSQRPSFSAAPAAVAATASPARSGGIDWLSALVGALIGVAISMIGFYFLINSATSDQNATMASNAQRVTQIETALTGQVDTMVSNMDALASDSDARLNEITEKIGIINTDYDAINTSIESIDASIAAAEAAVASLDEAAAALSEVDAELMASDVALGEQITTLDETVGVFDGFLVNLRDLLITLKGVPEVEEPVIDESAIDTDTDADNATDEADIDEADVDVEEAPADADTEESDTEGSDAEEIINSTPEPEPSPTPVTIEVPDSQ